MPAVQATRGISLMISLSEDGGPRERGMRPHTDRPRPAAAVKICVFVCLQRPKERKKHGWVGVCGRGGAGVRCVWAVCVCSCAWSRAGRCPIKAQKHLQSQQLNHNTFSQLPPSHKHTPRPHTNTPHTHPHLSNASNHHWKGKAILIQAVVHHNERRRSKAPQQRAEHPSSQRKQLRPPFLLLQRRGY